MPNNIRLRVHGIFLLILLALATFAYAVIDYENKNDIVPLGYKSADGDFILLYQDEEWTLNHDIVLERAYKSADSKFIAVEYDEGFILNQDIVLERESLNFKWFNWVNWLISNQFGFIYQPIGLMAILLLVLAFVVFGKCMPPPYIIKQCFVKDKPPSIYPDLLPPDENITGVISWREWRFSRKSGVLKSTKVGKEWENPQMVADEIPVRGRWHGIHAFRLGVEASQEFDIGYVSGLVSQSGIIIGHGDNVLRSEKCKILCLITKKRDLEPLLRERYGCPVYVVKNDAKAINAFTISDSGIYWLSHNNRVIKDYLQEVY